MKTNDPARSCSEQLAQASDDLELSEDQLEAVSGGTDAKKKSTAADQQQFLEVKFTDLLVTS